MKVLITDPLDAVCVEMLGEKGIQTDIKIGLPKAELLSIVADYDAWLLRSGTKIDADLIAAADKMQIIGRAGVGVDNVDLQAATKKGIIVINAPDGNTLSTAEHTCSMLLAMTRRIAAADASIKSGKWDRKSFTGAELFGKTLGVVGAGKIGRAVAERMKAFEMNVLAFDPMLAPSVAERMGIKLVDLEEIYAKSDFITVHTPMTDATRNLFNKDTLSRCKKGVYLINCARGGIINEADLLDALVSGQVAGVALDVFSTEPLTEELQKLANHPHVTATPHIAASTVEAQQKVAESVTAEVIDLLEGRPVRNAVNSYTISLAAQPEIQPYLVLAEKLGSMGRQLLGGSLQSIKVKCNGEIVKRYADILSVAVLRGVLSTWEAVTVNYINAPHLAQEMGIAIEEQRGNAIGEYANLIEVRLVSTEDTKTASGTVFGKDDPRIVKVDNFEFEVRTEGNVLFYTNPDRPGMLAAVGSLLAKSDINIASLALGRKKRGDMAMTAIAIDEHPTHEILSEIANIEGISQVKLVSL